MPNRVQIQIIKDALDLEHLLNEWESGFIRDIAEYDDDRELSTKENKVLNQIGNKINRGEV